VELWVIWLLVGCVLLLAEMLTLTFYLFWIGIGAWTAAIVGYLLPHDLYAQMISGAAAAFILTLLSQPLTRKWRESRGFRDAIHELPGKEALVVEPIEAGKPGIIKVGGEMWSAVSDQPLSAGETVLIIRRGTATVEVRKKED
jgi:membrane protein implicated in regulation of membrane protease activity